MVAGLCLGLASLGRIEGLTASDGDPLSVDEDCMVACEERDMILALYPGPYTVTPFRLYGFPTQHWVLTNTPDGGRKWPAPGQVSYEKCWFGLTPCGIGPLPAKATNVEDCPGACTGPPITCATSDHERDQFGLAARRGTPCRRERRDPRMCKVRDRCSKRCASPRGNEDPSICAEPFGGGPKSGWRAALATLLLLTAGVRSGVCGVKADAPAPQLDLEAIIERVMARQERVKSLRYAWKATRFVPKGSMGVHDPETGEMVPGTHPAEDTSVEHAFRCVVEGDRVRVHEDGQAWHDVEGTFVPVELDTVYVEGERQRLIRPQLYASVGVQRAAAELVLAPLLEAYRLFDSALGQADPDEVRVAGRGEHEGHPCVVLEQRVEKHDVPFTRRWWLAEDMDYVVVGSENVRDNGDVLFRFSMRYKEDEQVGWRLTSWDYVERSSTTRNVVTQAEFNQPVEPDAFELEFPPGTRVYDAIRDIRYVAEEAEREGPPPG